jgi:hypothetical protein
MDMQFAEATPKGLVLITSQMLVSDDQYHPIHEGLLEIDALLIRQWLRYVEAPNLSPDMRRQRPEFE